MSEKKISESFVTGQVSVGITPALTQLMQSTALSAREHKPISYLDTF